MHSIECDYALLLCPNECCDCCDVDSQITGDKIPHILRKDMDKHLSEECPKREYECPHCFETGEYQEMTSEHLEECEYIEIPCPNEGCDKRIKRKDIYEHYRTECEFEPDYCRYANIGCKVKVIRKDLEEHENDIQLHLKCAIDKVSELEETVVDLDSSVQELDERVDDKEQELQDTTSMLQNMIKQQENVLAHLHSVILSQSNEICKLSSKLESLAETCDPAGDHEAHMISSGPRSSQVFKFTNFAERKSSDKSVYSPPFYSSPGGYKMCFKVYANGCGSGKGSHVSVFAYLMRGENDDHLSWPFTGTVKIEILNQLWDRNHHLMNVEFKQYYGASQRVVVGDRAKVQAGRGKQHFISHSSLDRSTRYLKNDCLYIRFEIKHISVRKPWLSTANVF